MTREGLLICIFTAHVSLAFHHHGEGAVLPSSALPAAFEARLTLLRWFADPEDVWEVRMEQDLECWSWQGAEEG